MLSCTNCGSQFSCFSHLPDAVPKSMPADAFTELRQLTASKIDSLALPQTTFMNLPSETQEFLSGVFRLGASVSSHQKNQQARPTNSVNLVS